MPRDPLAPQAVGAPVPPVQSRAQVRAAGYGTERADHRACDLQPGLHPLHPHRGLRQRQLHRRGQLGPGEPARDLQPPQGNQLPVVGIQPAGGLRRFLPLTGQAQHGDRQIDEVGSRVREQGRLLQALDPVGRRRTAPQPPVPAHLSHRDGHQPGPECLGVTQRPHVADHLQHDLLHDIVRIGRGVQRASHDVVDQGEVPGHQVVEGPLVAGLRSAYDRGLGPAAVGSFVPAV